MRVFRAQKRVRSSGEAWKVIYIDLMTNVTIFFVILWSISKGKDMGVSPTVGDETRRMVDLPGDVLFPAGKAQLTPEGRSVFKDLFSDEGGAVLDFETSPVVRRMLVIHGHTDRDGTKEQNLSLGFNRALSAFQEIKKYGSQLSDHVVICSHADNSPEQEVPHFEGSLTEAQRSAVSSAKAKNRRITLEDKVVSHLKEEE